MIALNTVLEPFVLGMPHSPEWHAARLTGFGASESAAACGRSHYQTRLEVYYRKRGLLPAIEDNEAMKWGRLQEPLIVHEFADFTGIAISRYPCPMLRHPEHSFMLATPDAELANGELLDAKSTCSAVYRSMYGEEGSDYTPVDINFQGQQQLAVTGRGVCHIATLVDGRGPLKLYRIVRNDGHIDQIVKAEAELWERIQNGDPPPPDYHHPSTVKLMKALHRDIDPDKIITLSAALAEVRRERNRFSDEEKEAGKEKDARDAQLRNALGDAVLARFDPDEQGVPCEFELTRSEIKETVIEAHVRKGYFRINQRKSRA